MRLREYTTRNGVDLTLEQRRALEHAKVRVVPSEMPPGTFDLTPTATVGVVRVDGRQFHIQPKVGIRRLLFLLSFAHDADWIKPWLADVDESGTVLDAMATVFAHMTDRALGRGVRHGYRRRHETAMTVRGRIDMAGQFRRHHGRFVPLELDFDDYTIDTDANRILLAAVGHLRGLATMVPATQRMLARTLARLEGVTYMPYTPSTLPAVQLNRLDDHYKLPLHLARLIIGSQSIEVRTGTQRSTAMLFNMNTLFEDFVVTALREELGLDKHSFPREARERRLALDHAGRVKLKPDLSWWDGDRCRFVGDVKYKRLKDIAGIKHPDLYQVLAYATATGLPTALLVYAKGESPKQHHQVVRGGPILTITTVDLEQELDGLRAEIRRIADLVLEQAQSVAAVPVESRLHQGSDAVAR